MRPAIILALCAAMLAGCNVSTAKPRAKPKRAATKATPAPAAVPVPERPKPKPPVPVWRVVSVHDGDTVRAIDAAKVEHVVRLNGIDAPEIGQPFGTVARDHLAAMTKGKAVAVRGDERDRYGRTLARIEIEGQDVNRAMVAAGMAWHFTRYSHDATLAAAEAEARAAGRGLWADREPVPPWDWRATEKARKAAKREPAGR